MKKRNFITKFIVFFLVITFFSYTIAYAADDNVDANAIIAKPDQSEIINFDRIYLHQNADTYLGKWVRIAGSLSPYFSGDEKTDALVLDGPSKVKTVCCYLMSDQDASKLLGGSYVTIVGKVKRKIMGQLYIYNCYIESTGETARAFDEEMQNTYAAYNKDSSSSKKSLSKKVFGTTDFDKSSALQLTAQQAYDEMESNQVACKQKYDGKLVAITGTIDDIGTNVFGQEYVTFAVNDEYALTGIQCFFKNDKMDYVSSLQKGQKITLYGIADIGSMTFKLGESQP